MGFKCGIVGLPNVGKSTLFNALMRSAAAQAANFPFCTIEPNVGEAPVPDSRLDQIAAIAGSKAVIPNRLTFVDIAGLVRGASKGEGLGNAFLAHIRETDAIAQVLRCFDGDDVTHVDGRVDPIADAETIETELLLADLQSVERRLVTIQKRVKGGEKEAITQARLLERAKVLLDAGKPARLLEPADEDEARAVKTLHLLSAKPVVYVSNVDEGAAAAGNAHTARVAAKAAAEDAAHVTISAEIEAEISQLDDGERGAFLESLALEEAGLDRLIRAGYGLLDLITFFTAGPKETRAWTLRRGSPAPKAAGVIHSDFERGFIRAETIAFDDYVAHNGENGAKEAGKMRAEGKDYVVRDGDVLHFRFNV